MATVVVERVPDSLRGGTRRMLIGAEWVDAASGETFETLDPATEEVLAAMPQARIRGRRPRGHARHARPSPRTPRGGACRRPSAGKILHRIGDLILEHGDELALLDSLDNGKPMVDGARRRRARVAPTCSTTCRAGRPRSRATRSRGRMRRPAASCRSRSRSRSASSAQIIPWNFPLIMAARKLGPGARLPAARSCSSRPSRRRSRRCASASCAWRPGSPRACSTSSPATGRPAPHWPRTRTSTRSPSPGRPRSAG